MKPYNNYVIIQSVVLIFLSVAGNFEVGVHIADVSYFVEEGNSLDVIASQRATSVYLVQKVSTPRGFFPRVINSQLSGSFKL